MRIIAGKHKGRRLNVPKNLPVRPTTDRAREALFSILWNRFSFGDLTVLDLFAGTGALSFEFASRGVPIITAVDSHYGCIKFINNTAKSLKEPIRAIKKNTFDFLSQTPQRYKLIFADPPYELRKDDFERIINLVFERGLLEINGVLILEHAKQMNFSDKHNFSEERKYGDSVFSFFENTKGVEKKEKRMIPGDIPLL